MFISEPRSSDRDIYLYVVLPVLKHHNNLYFTNLIYFHNMQL